MDSDVQKANEVFAWISRDKASRQLLEEACEELGFDLKTLKFRSLANFQKNVNNKAIQRVHYEHYNTRRNFKVEKVIEYLADKGFLDDFQLTYVEERKKSKGEAPLRYKSPVQAETFFADVPYEAKANTVDSDLTKVERLRKVQENLQSLKLKEEEKRLELVKQLSQRYSRLDEDLKVLKIQHQDKSSQKAQRRRDILAKHLKAEAEREEREARRRTKTVSDRESSFMSRSPQSGRHSRIVEQQSRLSSVDKSPREDDLELRLLHIESKLEKSVIIATQHQRCKSSSVAISIAKVEARQVNKVKSALLEREKVEHAQLVKKVVSLMAEYDESAVILKLAKTQPCLKGDQGEAE
jgi:hypothetical protein